VVALSSLGKSILHWSSSRLSLVESLRSLRIQLTFSVTPFFSVLFFIIFFFFPFPVDNIRVSQVESSENSISEEQYEQLVRAYQQHPNNFDKLIEEEEESYNVETMEDDNEAETAATAPWLMVKVQVLVILCETLLCLVQQLKCLAWRGFLRSIRDPSLAASQLPGYFVFAILQVHPQVECFVRPKWKLHSGCYFGIWEMIKRVYRTEQWL
jgi:hypothetical protein